MADDWSPLPAEIVDPDCVQAVGIPPGIPAAVQSTAHCPAEEICPKLQEPDPEVGWRMPDQSCAWEENAISKKPSRGSKFLLHFILPRARSPASHENVARSKLRTAQVALS